MNNIERHPIIIGLLRPVARKLIKELEKRKLPIDEAGLKKLAEDARKHGMQGEIIYDGNREAFSAQIQQAISVAQELPPEECYTIINFIKVGCLRDFVLDEAIQMKLEEKKKEE